MREAAAALERDTGLRLDDGQRQLAETFCADDRRIVAAVGPAGSGKTTALRAACAGWDAAGRRVIPLATSAAAAEILARDLGRRAENVHKYLHELSREHAGHAPVGDGFFGLGRGDVLLIDEAGWPEPSACTRSSATPAPAEPRSGSSGTPTSSARSSPAARSGY